MFYFLKQRIACNKMAFTMDKINGFLKDLIKEKSDVSNIYEFKSSILIVAYLIRKGVTNRIEKNDFPLEMKLMAPNISSSGVTIWFALTKILDNLYSLSDEFDLTEDVYAILKNNDAFFRIESSINENERIRIDKKFSI